MTDIFIESKDVEKLTAQTKAALHAAFDLMETITADLSEVESNALLAVLNGGGRVGIELTADRNSRDTISLVGIEPEGRRVELARLALDGVNRRQCAH